MRDPVESGVAYAALRVRTIVADHLSVDLREIFDSSSFTTESLDFVELILALEEEFHREFSDEATDTIQTVGDAIRYLIECNRHRPVVVSLADSAKSYWLQSAKSP